VRAAVDGVTPLASANDGKEIETLPLFIGNSCPYREDWRSAWTEYLENQAAALRARWLISEAAPDIVCAEPTGKASFLNQALEKFMQGRVSEGGTARRAGASPSEGEDQFGPCCTCGVSRLCAVWADATEAIQKSGAMLKSPRAILFSHL